MLPQVADLLDKLEREREALLKALSSLSEEEAEVHPNNEWSAKQQISHVIGDELTWLSDALAVHSEPGAVVGHPPEAALSFFRVQPRPIQNLWSGGYSGFERLAPRPCGTSRR